MKEHGHEHDHDHDHKHDRDDTHDNSMKEYALIIDQGMTDVISF